jgi:hypothetical protein
LRSDVTVLVGTDGTIGKAAPTKASGNAVLDPWRVRAHGTRAMERVRAL